jgi:hypothetical protein
VNCGRLAKGGGGKCQYGSDLKRLPCTAERREEERVPKWHEIETERGRSTYQTSQFQCRVSLCEHCFDARRVRMSGERKCKD